MSHSTLVVFILSLVCAALAVEPWQCLEHEVFVDCASTCPGTCFGKPEVCPFICKPGCDCEPGYVRNSYGYCMHPALCIYDRGIINYKYL